MGSLYLTEMDKWFDADGIRYRTYDSQWKYRSRSTGGYDAPAPLAVMWHHTASSRNTSAQADADYMCMGSSDRPIANLMVDRTGLVWILAGGATNTNGKGKSITFSKGTVPADSMNTRAIGMEICNDGLGEPYSQAVIDACFKTSLCLMKHTDMIWSDCCTHEFYAPDRKVDPARAGTTVQGTWQPEAVNSSGTWSVTDLRNEHQVRWGGTPPDAGGDDMDEATLKRCIREVLNEGAAFGTEGDDAWADTNRVIVDTTRDTVNQILYNGPPSMQYKLDDLVKAAEASLAQQNEMLKKLTEIEAALSGGSIGREDEDTTKGKRRWK